MTLPPGSPLEHRRPPLPPVPTLPPIPASPSTSSTANRRLFSPNATTTTAKVNNAAGAAPSHTHSNTPPSGGGTAAQQDVAQQDAVDPEAASDDNEENTSPTYDHSPAQQEAPHSEQEEEEDEEKKEDEERALKNHFPVRRVTQEQVDMLTSLQLRPSILVGNRRVTAPDLRTEKYLAARLTNTTIEEAAPNLVFSSDMRAIRNRPDGAGTIWLTRYGLTPHKRDLEKDANGASLLDRLDTFLFRTYVRLANPSGQAANDNKMEEETSDSSGGDANNKTGPTPSSDKEDNKVSLSPSDPASSSSRGRPTSISLEKSSSRTSSKDRDDADGYKTPPPRTSSTSASRPSPKLSIAESIKLRRRSVADKAKHPSTVIAGGGCSLSRADAREIYRASKGLPHGEHLHRFARCPGCMILISQHHRKASVNKAAKDDDSEDSDYDGEDGGSSNTGSDNGSRHVRRRTNNRAHKHKRGVETQKRPRGTNHKKRARTEAPDDRSSPTPVSLVELRAAVEEKASTTLPFARIGVFKGRLRADLQVDSRDPISTIPPPQQSLHSASFNLRMGDTVMFFGMVSFNATVRRAQYWYTDSDLRTNDASLRYISIQLDDFLLIEDLERERPGSRATLFADLVRQNCDNTVPASLIHHTYQPSTTVLPPLVIAVDLRRRSRPLDGYNPSTDDGPSDTVPNPSSLTSSAAAITLNPSSLTSSAAATTLHPSPRPSQRSSFTTSRYVSQNSPSASSLPNCGSAPTRQASRAAAVSNNGGSVSRNSSKDGSNNGRQRGTGNRRNKNGESDRDSNGGNGDDGDHGDDDRGGNGGNGNGGNGNGGNGNNGGQPPSDSDNSDDSSETEESESGDSELNSDTSESNNDDDDVTDSRKSSSGGGNACPYTRDEAIYSLAVEAMTDANVRCIHYPACKLHPNAHSKAKLCSWSRERAIDEGRQDYRSTRSQRCRKCFCPYADHTKRGNHHSDRNRPEMRHHLARNLLPPRRQACPHARQDFEDVGLNMSGYCKCALRYSEHDDRKARSADRAAAEAAAASACASASPNPSITPAVVNVPTVAAFASAIKSSIAPLGLSYKIHDYPMFEDEKDTQLADPIFFLRKLGNMLDLDSLPDATKKKLLLFRSHGATQVWVRRNIEEAKDPVTGLPLTWEQARALFKRHFERPALRESRESEWNNLSCGPTESMTSFYNRILLMTELLDFDPDAAHVIQHYMRQLPSHIRTHINSAYYANPSHMLRSSAAQKFDTLDQCFQYAQHAQRSIAAESIHVLDQQKAIHGNSYNKVTDPHAKLTLDATQIYSGGRANHKKTTAAIKSEPASSSGSSSTASTSSRQATGGSRGRGGSSRSRGAVRAVYSVDSSYVPNLQCSKCSKKGHTSDKCTFGQLSDNQVKSAKSMIKSGVAPMVAISSAKLEADSETVVSPPTAATNTMAANSAAPPGTGTLAQDKKKAFTQPSTSVNHLPLGTAPPSGGASNAPNQQHPPRHCDFCNKDYHTADQCFNNPSGPAYRPRNTNNGGGRRTNNLSLHEAGLALGSERRHARAVYIQLPGDAKLYTVLLDTGATHSCIDLKLVNTLQLPIKRIAAADNQPVALADANHSVARIGTVSTSIHLHFMYDARQSIAMDNVTFEVMNLRYDFLIGLDIMQHTSPNDDGVRFNPHIATPCPKMAYFDIDLNGNIAPDTDVNGKPALEVSEMQARAAIATLARELVNNESTMTALEQQFVNLGVGTRSCTPETSYVMTLTNRQPVSEVSLNTNSNLVSLGRNHRACGATHASRQHPSLSNVTVYTYPHDPLNPDYSKHSPAAVCTQCHSSQHHVDACPELLHELEDIMPPQQQ
jgi:hypothetical protein